MIAGADTDWEAICGQLGIVSRCQMFECEPGFPRLWLAQTLLADFALTCPGGTIPATSGIGVEQEDAVRAALGEAVERYCAGIYQPDRLLAASTAELGEQAVGVEAFQLFTSAQYDLPGFPFDKPRQDDVLRWCPATSLHGGRARLAPAAWVFVPYAPADRADGWCHAVSTGQACHSSRELAILGGLLEVIERDACMITWLRGLRRRRLEFRSHATVGPFFRQHLEAPGLTYDLFDVTSDLAIPSVLCLVSSPGPRGPIFGVGSAARASFAAAATKALLEGYHSHLYARDIYRRDPAWRPAPDFTNVSGFEAHVRLYGEPEARSHLGFLLDEREAQPLPDEGAVDETAAATIARCLAALSSAGLEALVVDLTAPEIQRLGLHVVKVLVPGLVPLTATAPAVGPARLRSVPPRLGYRATDVRWNQSPHPFP